ncbi:MAG: ribosome silencing factor [Alphaproteobacteria bacterium]
MVRRKKPPRQATKQLLKAIEDQLAADKAEDIVVVDLEGKSSIADYMVIATGRSQRHVAATAGHLIEKLKSLGIVPVPNEGLRQGDWVLVDAGDIIVHLFRPAVRDFYNLEKMWGKERPKATGNAELIA